MADKYQAAIIEYRAANLAVKNLSRAIGAHLSVCAEGLRAAGIETEPDEKSPHLKEAYRQESDGMYGWQECYPDPVGDYLIDVCPHCCAAHLLIQERKRARQRFGVAKRRLMAMAYALEGGVL